MKAILCPLLVLFACVALLHVGVEAGASNSLADCWAVANAFNNTCDNSQGPIDLSTHQGTSITCTNLPSLNCPGTLTSGTCVFKHKLCVTCTNFDLTNGILNLTFSDYRCG